MSTVNFGRRIAVSVDGDLYEGLHIVASVTKQLRGKPPSAKVTIHNLPKATAVRYAERGRALVVQVRAAYGVEAGTPLTDEHVVFTGEPVEDGVQVRREGGDIVATFDLVDGLSAYRAQRVRIEEEPSQDGVGSLVTRVADALGYAARSVFDDPAAESEPAQPQGFTFIGYGRDLIDLVAEQTQTDVYVGDGELRFVGRSSFIGEGPLFSLDNGNLYAAKPTKDGVEVTGSFVARLLPGDRFRVAGEFVTGDFRAETVQHRLDSGFSSQFDTRVVGRRL